MPHWRTRSVPHDGAFSMASCFCVLETQVVWEAPACAGCLAEQIGTEKGYRESLKERLGTRSIPRLMRHNEGSDDSRLQW